MTNTDSIQNMINNLQQQLSSVSSMMAPQSSVVPTPTPPVIPTIPLQNTLPPDLFSIVKTAVQSELSRLGLGNNISNNAIAASTQATIPQQQQQQLLNGLNQNPLGFVLPIIGEAFTKDQQEWLSQPQILMGIPGFLMSGDGKTILNMMLDSYKEFLDKGNESK